MPTLSDEPRFATIVDNETRDKPTLEKTPYYVHIHTHMACVKSLLRQGYAWRLRGAGVAAVWLRGREGYLATASRAPNINGSFYP